jgi:hypothetical protein
MSRLKLDQTQALYQRAKAVMPWGVSSNFRYWGEAETPVIIGGQGAYIWDADGNRYIDYRLAFGPIILGHADPRVNQSVTDAIGNSTLFAHTQPLEIEVAERMTRMCPAHRARLHQPRKIHQVRGLLSRLPRRGAVLHRHDAGGLAGLAPQPAGGAKLVRHPGGDAQPGDQPGV